jgi:hypothetical protein
VTAVERVVTVLDEGIGNPAETPVLYVQGTVYDCAIVIVVIGTACDVVTGDAGVVPAGDTEVTEADGEPPAHFVHTVEVDVM